MGRQAEGQGFGLVILAAVLLDLIGFFNLIYGVAAIANSHVLAGNAHYVFANLRTWGWVTLIIGWCSCWLRSGCSRAASWPAGSRWPCSG
jgi:hypothetical protein